MSVSSGHLPRLGVFTHQAEDTDSRFGIFFCLEDLAQAGISCGAVLGVRADVDCGTVSAPGKLGLRFAAGSKTSEKFRHNLAGRTLDRLVKLVAAARLFEIQLDSSALARCPADDARRRVNLSTGAYRHEQIGGIGGRFDSRHVDRHLAKPNDMDEYVSMV